MLKPNIAALPPSMYHVESEMLLQQLLEPLLPLVLLAPEPVVPIALLLLLLFAHNAKMDFTKIPQQESFARPVPLKVVSFVQMVKINATKVNLDGN
jgi:hypothetical protein